MANWVVLCDLMSAQFVRLDSLWDCYQLVLCSVLGALGSPFKTTSNKVQQMISLQIKLNDFLKGFKHGAKCASFKKVTFCSVFELIFVQGCYIETNKVFKIRWGTKMSFYFSPIGKVIADRAKLKQEVYKERSWKIKRELGSLIMKLHIINLLHTVICLLSQALLWAIWSPVLQLRNLCLFFQN